MRTMPERLGRYDAAELWFSISTGRAAQLLDWWNVPTDATLLDDDDVKKVATLLRRIATGLERRKQKEKR